MMSAGACSLSSQPQDAEPAEMHFKRWGQWDPWELMLGHLPCWEGSFVVQADSCPLALTRAHMLSCSTSRDCPTALQRRSLTHAVVLIHCMA